MQKENMQTETQDLCYLDLELTQKELRLLANYALIGRKAEQARQLRQKYVDADASIVLKLWALLNVDE